MYSLPSASQMWEPCPRTMNGASHSTALNARTGELTPPGISCSARFCRRRHSSSLRGIYLPVPDQTTSTSLEGRPVCFRWGQPPSAVQLRLREFLNIDEFTKISFHMH